MQIQVLSDVHTEFHADGGRAFVESLDPAGTDVLVLAGDIAVGQGIPAALALFCRHFEQATVLYVHGNHEFYGCTRAEVIAATRQAEAANPRLVWLDGSGLTLGGRRFLAAPMWFPFSQEAQRYRHAMNDFARIVDFESWVYAENTRALAFFDAELRAGDIVVTHYLPSQASVAPQFKAHPLNSFFVCDVEALILERRPAVWIHGHTHSSLDYALGSTQVVCNPFGYAREEENVAFEERKLIHVTAEIAP